MRRLVTVVAMSLVVAMVSASSGPDIDVRGQAKAAPRVVVATVTDVKAAFEQNEFGDELIVSHVMFRVDETLKGPHTPTVDLTIEGGTIGDLTLAVSDMPTMERGQRAAVFLRPSGRGHVPQGRGAGVLKLEGEHVADSELTLADIRAAVKAAQGQ